VLLAARRQVVSVERLISDVWGDAAGDKAQGSLQVAISRLRVLIEPGRQARAASRILISSRPGYALLTPPGSVDSDIFADLVARAHTELGSLNAVAAAALCDRAIGMWTGPPFGATAASGLVLAETNRLGGLLVGAHGLRAEAMLALGRHELMTGELESLVSAHPWNERLRELHALALYRSGRQRDALAALRRAREVLIEELGIDPTPALQQLEKDILAQSPAVDAPARQTPEPAGMPTAPATQGVTSESAVEEPPLTGRADDLAQLRALLDAARGGRGETAVISGGPGIGKSRLVTELMREAAASDVTVLVGSCHGADVSPPYWPWIPVVRGISQQWPDFVLDDTLTPRAVSGDAVAVTLRTYDALARLIAAAAERSVLLIVLEDIHWADELSLRALAYALPFLRASRALVVATVRAGGQPSEHLQAALAELGRQSAARLTLQGLSVVQIGSLIEGLTGVADAALAFEVAERTDGNPFFVMELVRLLRTEERLDAAGARGIEIPHGVQDVLRARLAFLSPAVNKLLRVAAVIGRDFDLEVLCTVADVESGAALDLLDPAVLAHAVEETAQPGRFRFTHALVQETLVDSVLQTRQGFLHAAVGFALESRLVDSDDFLEEVAHRFFLGAAVRPQVAGRAVEHSMAAARVAEGRGAMDRALVLWQQAVSADALAQSTDLERRYEVTLGLGRARHKRGEVVRSGETLYEALDMARQLGDPVRMARAATSFRGAGVWNWREAGASDPLLTDVLEKCVAELDTGPLRARAMISLAMEYMYAWRSAECDRVGSAAVEEVRGMGDDELIADVLQLRALSLWGRPGAAAERLSLAREILSTAVSPEQELYTRFPAAAAHLQLGQAQEADDMVERCLTLARELRHSGADVAIGQWALHRAIAVGDTQEADRVADEALSRHRDSELMARSELAVIGRIRCRPAGTDPTAVEVESARGNANPHFRAFMGHVLAEAGRVDEGMAILGDPVPDGSWDYGSTWSNCLRIDVLAYRGTSTELTSMLDRIAAWGNEFAVAGSTDFVGSIEYFIGRGLEGLGNRDGARRAYAKAVQRNAEVRVIPWERRARARLAALT
jgi:DNA-binding SARP family transcriptional activator/tetratricopeptide (TPR) repeat protein